MALAGVDGAEQVRQGDGGRDLTRTGAEVLGNLVGDGHEHQLPVGLVVPEHRIEVGLVQVEDPIRTDADAGPAARTEETPGRGRPPRVPRRPVERTTGLEPATLTLAR